MCETKAYPNPCCRCGFCCLTEICPMALVINKIPETQKKQSCPDLVFDGDQASCGLASNVLKENIPPQEVWEAFGFGKGCCIKARAFRDGKEYDFASLPVELKKRAARDLRIRVGRDRIMAKALSIKWNGNDSDPLSDIRRMKKIVEEEVGYQKCGACGETWDNHSENCPFKLQQENLLKALAKAKE